MMVKDDKTINQASLFQDPESLAAQFRDPTWGARKLRDIFLFARFTNDELSRLYSIGRLVKLKAQAHVVIEGEPTRGLYILLYGRVSVYKTDQSTGNMMRLVMLEEGATFGEMSLFDAAPRSATVVAESHCFMFELDEEAFNRFLSSSGPDLQVRFYKSCAEELAMRFRVLNSDYINSQQLLWKYALRKNAS